jgi:predicted glycosyltransferase
MMPAEQVASLRAGAAGLQVRVDMFRPDMASVLAGARAVVSMAGYCTTAEVLASGRPALLVPRAFPREEQLNRARRLAAQGRVQTLHPEQCTPERLRQEIERLLAQPPVPACPRQGAAQAAAILTEMARSRTEPMRARPRGL